ncbi:Thiol-disulfide isomerase or thioredoxin [Halopseudomonas xinjiangensis]|uniref:Thiol-disulfide isomerase or thioredoxin n=1 Tax=Halopseudomonas xinjiangensis TaxID=487184 RepID=A0A1H1UJX8_9GAMM|nr:TlpA disulfide reductase family protein [Halopseudomonas xinjiangensis]SDS72775.1 Thiol-disulfide isomerase or thioredoxin [Halopseudomonas xinjiangensis]
MIRTKLVLLATVALMVACAPDNWTDQHGKRIEQQSLTSRWLVVNYWAEWCGPCREEIPELNALSIERPDVAVVGINFDGLTGEQLREVSDQMNIRFPVLEHEFAAAMGLAKPAVIPTTYLFAPGGQQTAALQGPQTAEALLSVIEGRSEQP